MSHEKYEAVIGLEVHIQLLTQSKAYSSDSAEYGGVPNTHVSPVSLGHPGTLPVLNKKVVEYAVKLGLACNCTVREENRFARKNYFYADLPKGYQITQDNTPVCSGGFICIKTKDGVEKKINLTRIHMEEDAGKSIHDLDPFDTLVDLNRAGVPLLEMVSEPDIRTGEEAFQYLTEVRRLVRYLDICDGNMEEGSLRCDANISVRERGAAQFGRKVEVKNMNSIRNVQRAIEFEIKRQEEAIKAGDTIAQETRSFDAVSGTTISMRTKEAANDYRYFTEPDLPPVIITQKFIEEVRKKIPALPQELFQRFVTEARLSPYDAGVLTDTKEIALYFDRLMSLTKNTKAAANWIMGPVKSHLNEQGIEITAFLLTPEHIASLIQLIDDGKVSHSVAAQKIFPALVKQPEKKPGQIAEEMNLVQESDSGTLLSFVEQALARYPDKVAEYHGGKTGVVGLFMGEVMKLSQGKADPKLANQLVKEQLEKMKS